jgi:ribosomal protein S18 acetylase RimI-like enzyme
MFLIRAAIAPEDPLIAAHFYHLWQDNNFSAHQLRGDWLETTMTYIEQARQTLSYQGFLAETAGQVIGSVGCQLFAGLYPLIHPQEQRRYGYIWGVYVEPEYRRQGIGKQLTTQAVEYLRSLHCTRVILHASPQGQPMYEQLGFTPSNEMRLDL